MVVPIVIGAAILAFAGWGKETFGKTTYNQIMKAGIALGALLILYLGYKAYRAYMDAKEAAEDVVEGITEKVTEGWEWILEGTDTGRDILEDKYDWLTTVTPKEFLPDVDSALSKVTPGNYAETYGPDTKDDVSLLQKIYWAPTAIITGTKDKTLNEMKDIHKDITTVPEQLKDKFDADVAKVKDFFGSFTKRKKYW